MQKELLQEEVLEFTEPLFYLYEKTPFGVLSQVAEKAGDIRFKATLVEGEEYRLEHETGVSFIATLKEGRGKKKGTYTINGVVNSPDDQEVSFFSDVNINGAGENGWRLRRAQAGAIHSLMTHWSLSNDVATVVLPTGTGKTETMLVATLVDRSKRTLVIVPTIDLKHQIADKFSTWGLLRMLGILPAEAPNPKSISTKQNPFRYR